MKRLVPILALVMMSTVPAGTVQDNRDPIQTEQVQKRLQEIKDRLELTPDQIERIRPLLTEEVQKLNAVREKYDPDDQNLRARLRMARDLRGVQDSTDEQLKKILSKTQMEEVKKIREEGRQRFLERERQN
jgi:hypothetical protein